jgi:CHRD domain
MKRLTIAATAILAIATTALAFSDEGGRVFREFLNGFKEAPNPIATTGIGTFKATISQDDPARIEYELTFQDLEGDVRQAHIHIGHPQASGGIVLWLCDSETNPSPFASTPECTADDPTNLRAGKVSGTLTIDEMLAVANNGVAAGEWEEVLSLIRNGRTYANVHSVKFPGGEVRAQLDNGDDDQDDHGQRH